MKARKTNYAHLEKRDGVTRFGCIRGDRYLYSFELLPTPDTLPDHIKADFDKDYLVCIKEGESFSTWKAYGPFTLDEVTAIRDNPQWLDTDATKTRFIDVANGSFLVP